MVDFIYDGQTGADRGITLVRNIHRNILPPVRLRMLKLSGRHGTMYIDRVYDERNIRVDVTLAAASHQSLRDRVRILAAWLNPENPRRLIFSDEDDKYYNAVLSGETDIEQLIIEGEGTLSFLCPDPFAYAVDPDVVMITTAPYIHIQRGTAPADPLFRLQGVSTGAGGQEIRLIVNAQEVCYTGALADGDWLEIDSESKSVVRVVGITQTSVMAAVVKPIFPQLIPGNNQIDVITAGGAVWSRLQIHCRNRWL